MNKFLVLLCSAALIVNCQINYNGTYQIFSVPKALNSYLYCQANYLEIMKTDPQQELLFKSNQNLTSSTYNYILSIYEANPPIQLNCQQDTEGSNFLFCSNLNIIPKISYVYNISTGACRTTQMAIGTVNFLIKPDYTIYGVGILGAQMTRIVENTQPVPSIQ